MQLNALTKQSSKSSAVHIQASLQALPGKTS